MVEAKTACAWMCIGILFLWLILPWILLVIFLLLHALGIIQLESQAIVILWELLGG